MIIKLKGFGGLKTFFVESTFLKTNNGKTISLQLQLIIKLLWMGETDLLIKKMGLCRNDFFSNQCNLISGLEQLNPGYFFLVAKLL